MSIKATHVYTDDLSGEIKIESDKIQVTSIRVSLDTVKQTLTAFRIFKVEDNALIAEGDFDTTGFQPAGFPKVGEIVAVFNDNNSVVMNETGANEPRFDQASIKIAWFRVENVNLGRVDSRKAMFDITRQVRTRVNGVKRNGNSVSNLDIKFPGFDPGPDLQSESDDKISDEVPNDDLESDDEDCETNDHDYLFSFDSPGEGSNWCTEIDFSVMRLNAYEFARVDFVNADTQNSGGEDGLWGKNKLIGTRCSSKIKWCTTTNLICDPDKKIDLHSWQKENPDLNVMCWRNRPQTNPLELKEGGKIVENTIVLGSHIKEDEFKTVEDFNHNK